MTSVSLYSLLSLHAFGSLLWMINNYCNLNQLSSKQVCIKNGVMANIDSLKIDKNKLDKDHSRVSPSSDGSSTGRTNCDLQ
jgi:hypothetical protein